MPLTTLSARSGVENGCPHCFALQELLPNTLCRCGGAGTEVDVGAARFGAGNDFVGQVQTCDRPVLRQLLRQPAIGASQFEDSGLIEMQSGEPIEYGVSAPY